MGKTTLLKAFKKASAQLLNFLLVISIVIPYGFFPKNVFAIATPSTNESNKNKGWAHVNVVSKDFNEITLEFVSTRTFSSCFEYRIDGDITQKTSDTNFNTEITDGLYPYYCQNNNTRKVKFTPNSYIEVRMVFGAEKDERFDWTKFEVPSRPEKITGLTIFKGHNSDASNNIGCNGYTNDTKIRIQWNPSSDPNLDYYWFGTKNNPRHKKISATQNWYDGNMTLGNNPYYYTVIAVNKEGYESEISNQCNLILDTEKPSTPQILGFKNPTTSCGGYTNVKNTTVDWSDSDGTGSPIKGYEYQINYPNINGTRGLWTTFFNSANSQYTGSLNEGRHYIRVRAQDMAGNWSDWSQDWTNPTSLTEQEKNQNCSIEYDSIVPSIPKNLYFWDVDNNKAVQCGGFSNTKHINEHWDAIDDKNFSHYEYSSFNAPSGSAGLYASPMYSNYFNSSWWTIPMEGTYGFQVRTVDLAGNISGWAFNNNYGFNNSCKITIDWTPPMVEITNPSDNQYVNGIIDFRGTVQDTNLLRYYYYIQDTTSKTITTDENILDETLYTWDTTLKPDGIYELRLEARDKANNKDNNLSIDSIKVIVDNTPPILETLSNISSFFESDLPEIKSSITEANEISKLCINIPEVSSQDFCIEGDLTEMDIGQMIIQKLGNSIPVNQYTIEYFAFDAAGNRSDTYSFLLTILTPPPQQNGLQNAQQAILGSSTTNGGAKRNTKATTVALEKLNELLGIGGPQESFLDNEADVKGSQTCENFKSLSGYVYLDANKNGKKDEDEKIFPNISIRIYTKDSNVKKTIAQVLTDEKGYWSSEVCVGEYYISIEKETLPNNYNIEGEDVLAMNIIEDSDEYTIDFTLLDTRNFFEKNWPWILLVTMLIGSSGIVIIDSKRKKL